MTAADPLAALLRSLAAAHGEPARPARPDPGGLFDPHIGELVHAFMVWEAGETLAGEAMARLHESLVDYNELRVCLPEDTVSMIGEKYPLAHERAARLHAALGEIYRREHAMSLSRAWEFSKRDARAYLLSLDGMHPFIALRVFLLGMGGHAAPVDSRIRSTLVAAQAVDDKSDEGTIASHLERTLRAGEAERAYLLLESGWAHAPRPKPPRESRRAPRTKARNRPTRSE